MGLKDKSSKINFGALPAVGSPASQSAGEARPKTAPGALMAHTNDQRSALLQENERLRAEAEKAAELRALADSQAAELRQWDGAEATRRLDPKVIRASQWANRSEKSFETADFAELKAEIANAGGNVQPIKVRPIQPADGPFAFELVFGHRRHRACLELGLPVLAVIESLGEQELFVEMDRENRARKALSPWEQGKMYQRALDEGLFPSNRKLAEQVGADLAQVGKAIALASLPAGVVDAFASPLDLQFRWSKLLNDAFRADPEGILERATKAKELGPDRSPKAVLEILLATSGEGGRTVPPPPIEVQRDGKTAARIELHVTGKATISFAESVISPGELSDLQKVIEAFLDRSRKPRR
jgi:ParB family chromosome partitioning protein